MSHDSSALPNTPAPQPNGRLVLVVGPSGAGKDTLINLARQSLGERDDVHFVRRIVTRPSSKWEDNLSMTEAEFDQAVAADQFALHWHAHGLSYALPGAMRDHLAQGHTVVANVSRSVIDLARAQFQNVIAVLITAPPEVLAARLANRKREDISESRAPKASAFASAKVDHTIVNDGDPSVAAAQLAALISLS